ncbi:MAG: hypothetical protein ACLPT4_05940 [Verrucomicrobiia bacterium]
MTTTNRLWVAFAAFVCVVAGAVGIWFVFRLHASSTIISVYNQRSEIAKECVKTAHWRNGNVMINRRTGEAVQRFDAHSFLKQVHAIDVSQCPKRFRLAWLDYVHAFDDLMDQANSSTILDETILGMIGVATRSSTLANRLDKPREAVDALKEATYHLDRIAVEYGVLFHPKPPTTA